MSVIIKMARGKYLTRLAASIGIKRRWFGLEPDFLLRKRATAALFIRPMSR